MLVIGGIRNGDNVSATDMRDGRIVLHRVISFAPIQGDPLVEVSAHVEMQDYGERFFRATSGSPIYRVLVPDGITDDEATQILWSLC